MADVTGDYYPSEGVPGYGAELLVGDGGSPEDFEAVPFINSITPGEMNTSVIDRTHLRSPNRHREKMAGIRDSGPWTVEMTYVPKHESQSSAGGGSGVYQGGGLIKWWIEATEKNWKIILNDGSPATEVPFRGFISRFQIGTITVDDKINVTMEITPMEDFSADIA